MALLSQSPFGRVCCKDMLASLQAVQATAVAEATRKANSSKARIELEEQMKERQLLILQQQVGNADYISLHHAKAATFTALGSVHVT